MSDTPQPPTAANGEHDPLAAATSPGDGRIDFDAAAPGSLAGTSPVESETDAAAGRALADAMRVSFRILQAAMVIVVVLYLGSGYYTVGNNEAVVVLRFGEIVQEDATPDGGGAMPNFTWPFPIGETITVPINDRDVTLTRDFWYQVDTTSGQGQAQALNPLNDGSLLTGDANVVHGRFTVTYNVSNPEAFVRAVGLLNEGDRLPGDNPEGRVVTLPTQRMAKADELVRNISRQAIIRAVASTEATPFTRGQLPSDVLADDIRNRLLALNCGLSVSKVSLTQPTVPLSVEDAYQAVNQAEARRATAINAAQQERSRVLAEVAGAAAEGLRRMLNDYELARTAQDTSRIEELELLINQTFDTLTLPEAYGGVQVGGEASTTINTAISDRTQVAEEVKAEAQRFRTLLAQYEANPELFRARLGWQAAQQILSSETVQTFWTRGDAPLYLETNRDPQVVRRLEERRLREAEERAEEEARNASQ
ncbi:MAG: SPFH domain-containing protein [Planctomycetota bacterium]